MPQVWENKFRGIIPNFPSHSLSQSSKSREDSHGSRMKSARRFTTPLGRLDTPEKTSRW